MGRRQDKAFQLNLLVNTALSKSEFRESIKKDPRRALENLLGKENVNKRMVEAVKNIDPDSLSELMESFEIKISIN